MAVDAGDAKESGYESDADERVAECGCGDETNPKDDEASAALVALEDTGGPCYSRKPQKNESAT